MQTYYKNNAEKTIEQSVSESTNVKCVRICVLV